MCRRGKTEPSKDPITRAGMKRQTSSAQEEGKKERSAEVLKIGTEARGGIP